MYRVKWAFTVVIGVLLPASISAGRSPQTKSACEDRPAGVEAVEFAFLVISNDAADQGDGNCLRNVHVLVDEQAFSEETLRRLSDLLSRAFVRPQPLNVFYYTNIDQLDPFGPAQMSSVRTPGGYFKHHRGYYRRSGDNELIRYTENATDRRLKAVVIRGVDSGLGD